MTLGLLAFVLMAHFVIFLASLAFVDYTGCTYDDLTGCSGGSVQSDNVAQQTYDERRNITGIGFIDQTIDFASDMFGGAARLVDMVFGLFTFRYRILTPHEGVVGSSPGELLVSFFRLALTVIQAWVLYRMTMTALGRG